MLQLYLINNISKKLPARNRTLELPVLSHVMESKCGTVLSISEKIQFHVSSWSLMKVDSLVPRDTMQLRSVLLSWNKKEVKISVSLGNPLLQRRKLLKGMCVVLFLRIFPPFFPKGNKKLQKWHSYIKGEEIIIAIVLWGRWWWWWWF